MTHMARISLVVCILVSVILIGGGAFVASAQNLRRIVTFQGIDLTTPLGYATALGVVTASGSSEVHDLSLVNALAIQLPANNINGALNILLSSLCGPITQQIKCVQDIANDTLSMVDGGSHPVCIVPAAYPVPERDTWGMQHIGMPAVRQQWPDSQGTGVQVAILDTGIKPNHSELWPRIAEGYNARAWANPSDYQDDNGHGTHMAGIIAADLKAPPLGTSGIIGVAPKATLLAVKVLDRDGAGYLSDFINGLQWVYGYKNGNNGTPLVVSMSVGFPDDSAPLKKAIQKLFNTSGVIMVASAGNRCAQSADVDEGGGDDCQGPAVGCDPSRTTVRYPAAYQAWVIAVGAEDFYGYIPDYSLAGPQVDVVAPGGSKATGIRILSTTIGPVDSYGWGSGTSQAAAHVAGAVALALELQPGLSLDEVQTVLQTTATSLVDPLGQPYPKNTQGEGLINVDDMVRELLP